MPVPKRCIRCNKKVRVPEGTCQNPKCVLYVPDKPETTDTTTETTTTTDNGGK